MLNEGQSIRVMIADDHEFVRLGLRAVLEESGIEIVGECKDGVEAVQNATRVKPDILLLDLRMPEMGGVEACKLIHQAAPDIKIVVLTSFSDDDEVFGALSAGAVAYLMKDISPDNLVRTVKGVAAGQTVLDAAIAQRVLDGPRPTMEPQLDLLSPREHEVLQLMAQGLTNRQIAARLWISEPTVKTHVSHILAKLEQPDRTQAIVHAMRHGLVAPPGKGSGEAAAS